VTASFLRSDSAGCTSLRSSRLVHIAFPPILKYIREYIRAPPAQGFLPPKGFTLCRSEDGIQAFSTKKGPYLVSADVLANYSCIVKVTPSGLALLDKNRPLDRVLDSVASLANVHNHER
jgi:hypothetical protein